MHFLKTGLLFATSTLSKLLAGLVVVKIVAVYIGAEGLGRLGQFMSLMSMVTILAGGGITAGIIKYVAQHSEDQAEVKRYLGSASCIAVLSSILLGAGLFLFATQISFWLMKSADYAYVLRILALAQVFVAASNLLMGLLSGHKRAHAFAAVNAAGAVIGATGVGLGCMYFGIEGAMLGLIWMPACLILLLLPWYRLGLGFAWRDLAPRWERAKIGQFAKYSLMLVVTVLTMQMSQIIIRDFIEARSGWVQVGYWQAVTRVSDAYLQFITVVLANYYLPRLSALRSRRAIETEVRTAYTYAMPALVVMGAGIFVFRDIIIRLLFSEAFLPMKEFFTWQLMGDGFKVAAYIAGYVAVAKANTRLYLLAEAVQAGLLISLSYLCIARYGAVGATYAYCLCYAIYFILSFSVLKLYFSRSRKAD